MNIPGTFKIYYGFITDLFYFVDESPDTEHPCYVMYPSSRAIIEAPICSELHKTTLQKYTRPVSKIELLLDTGLSISKAHEIYTQCISNHTTQAHTTLL